MKKTLLPFLSLFILLTAFTCENETLDEGFDAIDPLSNDCDSAMINLQVAANAYNNSSDSNFTTNCLNYKEAIQNVISFCGDPSGAYLQLYSSLGDCSNGQTNQGGLLDKVLETTSLGLPYSEFIEDYTYNGNKLIKIDYEEGEYDSFIYESENLVKIESVFEDSQGDIYIDYSLLGYDSQNRLILETNYDEEDNAYAKTTFLYNNDQTITVSDYSINQSGVETLSGQITYQLSNGNIIHEESTDYGYTADYTYDDKNGYLSNVFAKDALILLGYVDGNNNPTSVSLYYNGVLDTSESTTSTYTYNNDDFPISEIVTNQGLQSYFSYIYQ